MAEKKSSKKVEEKKPGKEVGVVTHYYPHISVAVVKITSGSLKNGDSIRIKGHKTDFTQAVDSMQIDHEAIEEAKKGLEIGMKVADDVRENDKVYKAA